MSVPSHQSVGVFDVRADAILPAGHVEMVTIDTPHIGLSCSGDSAVLTLGPRGEGTHTVATYT